MKWQGVKSRPLHRLGHRPNRCSKQHIAIVPDAEIMLRCKVQRDRSTGLRGTRVSAAKSQYADQWSGPLPLTDNTPRAAPRWSLPVADLCSASRAAQGCAPFAGDASGQSRERMLRRKVSSHGVYSGGLLSCHAVVAGGTREPNNI